MYPEELRYTAEHEWVRLEADGTVFLASRHLPKRPLATSCT